ncbi:MAG: septum formation initiator family protein [Clostridia bacterium]|nr:septum formation initiator family protein [Clostridia bacterium]
MPAVDFDYDYAKKIRSNQGVAKNARSISASSKMSAQRKVSSNRATSKVVTRNGIVSNKVTSRQAIDNSKNQKLKRQSHVDIDIPIVVKKKVEIQKPEEMKLKNSKLTVSSNQKTEKAKKSIIATVLAFGILFIICTRYAQINELTHKINSLEKDLASAESLNQQLGAEVDSKTDLSYIEKYAKYQLGMQKPDEKQIVRIAYDKQDRISTPIVVNEESEPSFFEKLFNDLKNIID